MIREELHEHWILAVVLGAFVGTAFLIPTLAPVATSDDFLFARSIEILVRDQNVRVLPAAAMSLVFQIAWGGLFATVFGDSLGVLRAATVTFAGIGGLAMYVLCRELRVSRGRSALAVAVFLFNPISLSLAYSFMTDTYFLTLVTVAVWCYVRGLRTGEPDVGWTVAGSVATGLAFLVRQPGILLAVGVVTYLAATGRLRWDRASFRALLRVVLAPLLMAVAYLLWFRFLHGVPEDSGQAGTIRSITDAGVGGTLALARRLAVVLFVYIGLFTLPVTAAAVISVPGLLRGFGRRRALILGGAVALPLVLSIAVFAPFTSRRPWTPQFFGPHGVGPIDIRGGRPPFLSADAIDVMLLLAVVSTLVFLVAVVRGAIPPIRTGIPGPGVLAAVGLWLALVLIPQSMPLRTVAYSYDRYFLPLLPLVVAGLLVALRGVRIVTPLAWSAVVVVGAFSVAATHDHLALQDATWELAAEARASGVPLTDIDAGAAWDGYHLYEEAYRKDIKVDLRALKEAGFTGPLRLSERDGGAWWISYYAPSVTSHYVVSSDRLYGYELVDRLEYSSWLHDEPQYVYLQRLPEP